MMEVKHSPSSQMDFRTATNGLTNEEDVEMNALLDKGAIVKSLPTSSCDSGPKQNGTKHAPLEDGMEIDLLDDEMDEELNKTTSSTENKKENAETETATETETKEDNTASLDLFDLELESAAAAEDKKSDTNGDIVDSSSVRDPGDDLDTLLSKINDLVEDCMEPSIGDDSPKEVAVEKELLDEEKSVEPVSEEKTKENKAMETEEVILDDTEVTENDDVVEPEESEAVEFEEKNEVDSPSVSNLKDTEDDEIGADEDLTDDLLEVKSTGGLSEDVSEENGLEVTENELEMAVEEGPEEIQEYIPGATNSLSQEGQEDEDEEEEDAEKEESEKDESEKDDSEKDEAEKDEIVKELADDEIPPADTDTVEDEVVKEDVVAATEKDAKEKVKPSTENMDVDDDIVCLDSPMPPEEEKEVEKLLTSEKLDEDSSPTVEQVKEEHEEAKDAETPIETVMPSKEVIPEETPAKDADDEIFLIEDDDEPIKKADPVEKPEEKPEESAKAPEEEKKSLQEDPKRAVEEESKEKPQVTSEEKPVAAKEVDEDDVVCLDDSLEESEESKQEEKLKEENTEKSPNDADTSVAIVEHESVIEEDVQKQDQEESVETVSNKETIPEKESVVETEEKVLEEEVPKTELSVEKTQVEGESVEQVASSAIEKTVEPTDAIPKEPKDSDETKKTQEISSQTASPSKSALFDNDVITLDDDDDDEPASAAEKKDEHPTNAEVSAIKKSQLRPDNSDNARDGVEEKDDKSEPKESAEKSIPLPSSEVHSNSSSNLLKETTATQQEELQSEPCEQPPAKRIRLSQDEASSRNSNGSREEEETNSKRLDDDDVMILDDEENKVLKRVHSTTELTVPDVKKPKTDVDSSIEPQPVTATETKKIEDEKPSELLNDIIPTKAEPVKEEEDKKPADVKSLPLYPAPNFDTPNIGLSLDFLRRFKKSIHKMTKSDLEELVLQKIVETIVHKSEFSEMRELIEKQEKIISGHRTKITELNKQFRDLEMVHNRVLKDLETKNSQFIMPVKITRAVGLQVFFPNKKYDQPMAALPSASPSSSALSRSVSTSSSSSSVPDRATSSSSTMPPSMISQSSQGAAAALGSAASQQQQRRGCVQKLTPMRPDGPRVPIAPNRGAVTPGVVSSSTPSPMMAKDISPKILNRQVPPKPRLSTSPMGLNLGVPGAPQPHNSYPTASNADPARNAVMSQGIATKKTSGTIKTFPPSKRIPKSWQSEQAGSAQPSTPTTPTTSLPMVPPASPLANSTMVTKTPNRSVIDLTDEDDMTPAPSPRTPVGVAAAAQKQVNVPGGQRVGPYKVSVIPAAQLQQQPRPNQPKNTTPRPHNPPQMVQRPNGNPANVVRRTPPPPQSAQRYRHPAPLPNQPIHSSNPLWKLPPARPTIRISNLESGIVISWTIEDMAKEKYAESTSYQIYAYQETSGPPLVESWRHVGDVKAMLLPMAVTLTQFQEGQRYYFAVRAVDAHNRCGPFSFAKTWS